MLSAEKLTKLFIVSLLLLTEIMNGHVMYLPKFESIIRDKSNLDIIANILHEVILFIYEKVKGVVLHRMNQNMMAT